MLAEIWAALFCAAHLYWAAGGSGGLPADARTSNASLAVDLIAIPLCLAGILVAQGLGNARYRATPFVLGSAAAAMMLWNTALNYLFLAVRQLTGQPITAHDRFYALLYEPFWLIGGVLWLLAVMRYRWLRSTTFTAATPSPSAVSIGVAVDLSEQPRLERVGRE
jgi:hypothetical protein